MRKSELSFLELFQDPLFTMIAIVLMGTVWIILPIESTPVDTKVLLVKDEISSLENEIALKEGKSRELKDEINNLREKFTLMERGGERRTEKVDKGNRDINASNLTNTIVALHKDIENRKKEIEELEDELKKARDKLLQAKGKEAKPFMESIDLLEKEIEKKRENLAHLEERIINAKKEHENTNEQNYIQNNLIDKLQNELSIKLAEIKKLEITGERVGSGGGFKKLAKAQGEKDFDIQLINNRLFLVDDEHYNVRSGNLKMEGGSTVQVTVVTRKSAAKGENINDIQKPESEFQKLFKRLDPKKYRIYFYLNNDSFEIFRLAREIVKKNNFELSWLPQFREEILYTSAGGERPGSTDIPKK